MEYEQWIRCPVCNNKMPITYRGKSHRRLGNHERQPYTNQAETV